MNPGHRKLEFCDDHTGIPAILLPVLKLLARRSGQVGVGMSLSLGLAELAQHHCPIYGVSFSPRAAMACGKRRVGIWWAWHLSHPGKCLKAPIPQLPTGLSFSCHSTQNSVIISYSLLLSVLDSSY